MLALAWVFAPGAVAGGPTSVLITSPESGETAALYNTDEDYAELLKQLGPLEDLAATGGQKELPPSLDTSVASRQINVTWMVHDVQPWRVDQVHLSTDTPTVWISTASQMPSPQGGTWHKAKQPAAVHALVRKLGLMGKKNGSGGAISPPAWETGVSAAPADPNAQAGERKPETRPAAAGGGAASWWWAAAGLAAGTALGLALRPLAGRLPRPPFGRGGAPGAGGPRQQLLDL
ncbi:hypothetical protein ACFVWX_22415 [Streptomyces sp. NPDC058220]|uniref:hypothetical protein n=1 Tax=Streptomyces sp. NPDC058220 TaxID=3346387 RepID=UPI0036EBAB20